MRCTKCKKEVKVVYEIKIYKTTELAKLTFVDKLSKAFAYAQEDEVVDEETGERYQRINSKEVYIRKFCEKCIPQEISSLVVVDKI